MNDHVTSNKRRRREHSPQFKRELVSRSLEPGASVAAVALEAGVNFNLLYARRRMHRDAQARDLNVTLGAAPILLPVTVEFRLHLGLVTGRTFLRRLYNEK